MKENCRNIEPLLAGYALEALSSEESLLVEAHIQTCETCQEALEDYRAVSDGLMKAVPPKQPPGRIRARLLAEIAHEALPAAKKQPRFRFRPRLTTALGWLTILLSVGLNFYLFRNTSQMLGQIQDLVQQNQTYQTGFILLTDPNAQVLTLEQPGLRGTLVYDPHGQQAILNVQGLAQLPPGQVYQLWLIEADETRISGGLFNARDELGSASLVINSPANLESFTGIGVTIEPEGGSQGPTGARVFGMEL